MADEQDEWLDRDAAERLLRGEPVAPPGAQARSAARSLFETLGAAARSGTPSERELAGEEAAVAAFRQVGPARGASGTGRHRRPVGPAAEAGTAPDAGTLDPVRIGTPPSSSGRRERPRFGRPVRIGLAASLAGCALGGVAVAAGTGALTGAFGGSEHGPTTSVSVAASTDGAAPDTPGTSAPAGTPDGTGDAPGASAGGTSGAAGGANATPGTGGPDGRDGTGAPGSRAGGYGDGTVDRGTFGGPGGSGGSDSDGYAAAVEDCHDYRDGHLDDREKLRLARLARGEANIPAYCATVTGSSPKGSGTGDGSDGPDRNGAGDGSDRTGGDSDEWDPDTYQQGQSSSFPLRRTAADGPATMAALAPARSSATSTEKSAKATDLSAAPPVTPSAGAPGASAAVWAAGPGPATPVPAAAFGAGGSGAESAPAGRAGHGGGRGSYG
ncbi:hypothetical protein [Streptomyces sp. NPDC060198]|uniref:hypothetical protein n=1 Tax=Streptomyces sp. NPDC060198 TaxID=3347070 RepID=UPI0036692CD2